MLATIMSFFYRHIKNPYIRCVVIKLVALNDGGYPFSEKVKKLYLVEHGIKIGYGTYGGCFHLGNIPSGVTFGNYCSIANGVKVFRANHPCDLFTTHPILYNPIIGAVESDKLHRAHLEIGHDVWIGANVIILPGVTRIGNGAVIGAGSIVTKDVDAYNIVAGNPAKIIKKRFSDRQIIALESSRWWELDKKCLFEKANELNKIIEIV